MNEAAPVMSGNDATPGLIANEAAPLFVGETPSRFDPPTPFLGDAPPRLELPPIFIGDTSPPAQSKPTPPIVHGDVLPDSRTRVIVTPKGMVQGPGGVMWVPVFCANCGHEGGLAPETSTFSFYLCNPCFERLGHLTCTMVVPDHEFYAQLAAEQQDVFGRPATPQELAQVVAEDSSALAKLLKEGAK